MSAGSSEQQTGLALDGKPRAQILFLCHPLTGHITPSLRVASELRQRGWPVSFLGPSTHRERISSAGVEFIPLQGAADIDDIQYYSPDNPNPPVPFYHSLLWYERALIDIEKHCLDPLPAQWFCVKQALSSLQERSPDLPVIVISEAFFHGILPLHFGAPLPAGVRRPRTLCLSVTPPAIRSADLPPFGYPFPFSQAPEGRARNADAWETFAEKTAPLRGLFHRKLTEAGATRLPEGPLLEGANYTCHGAVLQIGVPSFEYPRGDWPPHFRFVGFLPKAHPPPGGYPNLPGWWGELAGAAEKGRKVVVVAQGTVETDPNDLITPAIEAMRDRADVLVVAILGRRGAALPEDFDRPRNALVTDYLSYDAVLPYADVWVHNGGYGAITHGIAHGVPMVVAGEGQDKVENVKRVRFSGIGVGLGTPRPGDDNVKTSLEAVLSDSKFRDRVQVLRKETDDLDCFGRVEKAVLEALEQ